MVDLTMAADAKQLAGAKADISTLLGDWINCKAAATDHIARITMSERDGEVVLRPYGAPVTEQGEPIDWGETVATPYVVTGRTEVIGFHARSQVGAVHTELAANEKFGVLVIQSYTSFHDDSGRLPHYAREFFHRAEDTDPATPAPALSGEWVNFYATTKWIKGFTLTPTSEGAGVLRVFGVGDRGEWGEAPASLYTDNLGEPAFRAEYDLGDVRAVLAANTNKALTIIAAFLHFKDEDKPNFLCREFFFRTSLLC